MQVEETPGSATSPIGRGICTLLPITRLGAMGARGGSAVAGHDGWFSRARSDESLLGEDGVIWI